jgi:hypothetical protein
MGSLLGDLRAGEPIRLPDHGRPGCGSHLDRDSWPERFEPGDGTGDRARLQRLHVLMRVVPPDPGRPVAPSRLDESSRRRAGDGDDAVHVIATLDEGRLVGGSVSR